jgi:predicted ABC-type ATPase
VGYRVELVYFWVGNADLAVARVAQRVRQGGHDVPEATVRQRYQRSLWNFFELYRPLVHAWRMYDTTVTGLPELVAEGNETDVTVFLPAVWQRIQQEGPR